MAAFNSLVVAQRMMWRCAKQHLNPFMCACVCVSSAELWTKNDYKSCRLPSVVDDNDVDDHVSDDDVTTSSINYVIGDVLQPQNSDNTDAVIVHCVGRT